MGYLGFFFIHNKNVYLYLFTCTRRHNWLDYLLRDENLKCFLGPSSSFRLETILKDAKFVSDDPEFHKRRHFDHILSRSNNRDNYRLILC